MSLKLPGLPAPYVAGTQFTASLLSIANPRVTPASEVTAATDQLTVGLLTPMGTTGVRAAGKGADPHQLWNSFQEAGLQLWKQADATALAGLMARFSTDARTHRIDKLPANLGPTPPPKPIFSGDLFMDASNFFAHWGDTLTYGLTARIRDGLVPRPD